MTLLKATCISRRKFSLLLVLLLLPCFLAAAPFRTAVVCSDETYSALISDVLSVLSGPVTSESAISSYSEKAAREEQRAKDTAISSLRQNESFDALENPKENENAETWDGTLSLELVDASFSDNELDFLSRGDADAFHYLMIREDLDLLIVANLHEDGLMSESEVYVNGEVVHRSLFISSDDSLEFEALLNALRPFVKSSDTVVVHVDIPSVVSVSVDGLPASLIRSMMVTETGEHVFRFTSPLYETTEMTVDVEDGMTISPSLVEILPSRLFIASIPYDSSIYFQGLITDSHLVLNADVPFQITAMSSGFMPSLVQSRIPMDRIELELRPEWMESVNIVEEAKNRFYTNLLSTLISFGCYVASDSLSGIYTEADLDPAVTLFAGVSFVQLVELFDSMFDYYQAARLGI